MTMLVTLLGSSRVPYKWRDGTGKVAVSFIKGRSTKQHAWINGMSCWKSGDEWSDSREAKPIIESRSLSLAYEGRWKGEVFVFLGGGLHVN